MIRLLRIVRMPVTAYATAWQWQMDKAAAVRQGGVDTLALLQHPPVYTFGRRIRPDHLLVTREELVARGAEVVEANRGGDVTFHGPGQVVAYPIISLRRAELRPVDYVCRLEEVVIRAVARFGIAGYRVEGRPGVWTDAGKIGAIGVRVEGGVSLHGFALNVSTDLSYFDAIIPCGLEGTTVTSMATLLDSVPEHDDMELAIAEEFTDVFERSPESDLSAPQKMGALR
jgi:lipoate-protein ligase B